jgi:hypothetical protein
MCKVNKQDKTRQQYNLAYRLLRMEKHRRIDSQTVTSILNAMPPLTVTQAMHSHRSAHEVVMGWRWSSWMVFSEVRRSKTAMKAWEFMA